MRTIPDEMRDNWALAYQHLCVRSASGTELGTMQRFQSVAGITDRLIVYLIEEAQRRKRRHLLTWVEQVLAECAAHEVTTVEQWKTFDRERDQPELQTRHRERGGKRSNVFLKGRTPTNPDDYAHVYDPFGDGSGKPPAQD